MKALLKLITVCLIIAVLISPMVVIWKIWQYHGEYAHAQYLLAQAVQPDGYRAFASPGNIAIDAASLDVSFDISSSLSRLSSTVLAAAFLGFAFSLPIGFYSGLLLNQRHRTQRYTTLRHQVAILERIWQQSTY